MVSTMVIDKPWSYRSNIGLHMHATVCESVRMFMLCDPFVAVCTLSVPSTKSIYREADI